MPHPALNARIHLARHPLHPDAVMATITSSGTHTARALLCAHGFRPIDEHTVILVRIDHEEPYYADQAAHALREEGATVDISPGLQEDIDTEWTWANYPMPWLNRDEIREVSNEAQAIHDDIASGRLFIHAHADDGHTTVAVGTYPHNGNSVHLHGENHLRVVALVYDNPGEAIREFHRLYGDAIRPGPAPATDTERRAAIALATTTTGAHTIPPATQGPEPAQPKAETIPVYAADPGNHETLLTTFLDSHSDWEKYRTWSDETTIASHESLTLRAEFDHEAVGRDTKWTFAAYESPVGARLWHATATASTPVEIVRTLLDALAAESAWGTGPGTPISERTITEATRPLSDASWKQAVNGRWINWTAAHGSAGTQFDAFAAQKADSPVPTWIFWGGNTIDRPTWAMHFSAHTPVPLLQDLAAELAHGYTHRPASAHEPTPQSALTLPPGPRATSAAPPPPTGGTPLVR
ncbi:DUF317 domain-containing protein [Streptomyces orinoci]|uniref:DUF317 domain-containing protein n=1 Tax=Streptomyces orinoci TaxID=67339 RepID=A0ABV3JV45_STRON|nr:DUF317 domain-containing protein [Streptomyces orinoci]